MKISSVDVLATRNLSVNCLRPCYLELLVFRFCNILLYQIILVIMIELYLLLYARLDEN